MVRICQRHVPAVSIAPGKLDPNHLIEWQFILNYLQSSNASDGLQGDIDRAMSVLPHELVLANYTALIRTTFQVKIVPAITKVPPEKDNLIVIVQNLSDGLSRYEACFARLRITIGEITSPFQALVREQLNYKRWKPPFKEWIIWALSQDHEASLLKVYGQIKHVGLFSFFEDELATILSASMATASNEAHAKSWEISHLSAVVEQTIKAPQRLLGLLGLRVEVSNLEALARTRLGALRISELFDIVVEFPTSAPALEDLKQCLDSTEARLDIVYQYQQQLNTRLLHPGANTPDIITIYISTIKVFLLLDPPGVLLDKVARPIRKYLRERTDTIRCIITSLLGEVDGELAEELSEQRMPDEVDDQDDPNWLPDPIDASPDYAKNRASDIIGSLISIYENKDVFVKELQTLLADRLLAVTDYNVDQELRNLELLKVRFGEGMLSVCDVMLKDMTDSRRLDVQIHAPQPAADTTLSDDVLHTTILSRLYWPAIKSSIHQPLISADPDVSSTDAPDNNESTAEAVPPETGLNLPRPVRELMAKYSSSFRHLKAQRSLHFLKEVGHVRVHLQLVDRDFDMLVTPAHAASIYLFQTPDDNDDASVPIKLTLAQVSERLGTTDSETRRNLSFWQAQNILCLIDSQYQVLEHLPTTDNDISSIATTVSVNHQTSFPEQVIEEVMEEVEVDEMDQIWPFIVGMLTNVGNLPSERIQSMLGMFSPGYDKSEAQLKEYLVKKVRAGTVEFKAGEYRLSSGTAVGEVQ